MTREELIAMLEHEQSTIYLADGLEEAFIGVGGRDKRFAVYDHAKCIDIKVQEGIADGMTEEEALEAAHDAFCTTSSVRSLTWT